MNEQLLSFDDLSENRISEIHKTLNTNKAIQLKLEKQMALNWFWHISINPLDYNKKLLDR